MKDANGQALKPGNLVRIHPEWQDLGDDDFDRIVYEVPDKGESVMIWTLVPGFQYPPIEWIQADWLICMPDDE